MSLVGFLILVLATHRLTRLVTRDEIFAKPRERLIERCSLNKRWEWFANLITCPWCCGFWLSIAVVVGADLVDAVEFPLLAVFALSTAVGLLSMLDD